MEQLEPPLDDVIFIAGSTPAGRRAALDACGSALPASGSGRFQPERVIHATLVLAGAASDPRTVAVARETATLIRLATFELVFDTLIGFGGPKGILALTCSAKPVEWTALRKQLSQIPRRLGAPVIGGNAPHLTLGYGFPASRSVALAEPVVWAVEEFVLVQSLHGQSEHTELGRWSLGQ